VTYDDALTEIAQLRPSLLRPGMLAAEFAELLPQHLEGAYWRSKLEQLYAETESEGG